MGHFTIPGPTSPVTCCHLAGGQSHPAGKNRGLVWMADFRSRADFEAGGNLGWEPDEMALEADE
jgi:hypothetical protein